MTSNKVEIRVFNKGHLITNLTQDVSDLHPDNYLKLREQLSAENPALTYVITTHTTNPVIICNKVGNTKDVCDRSNGKCSCNKAVKKNDDKDVVGTILASVLLTILLITFIKAAMV